MLVAADDDNEDEESDDNDEEKDDEEKGDKEMRKRKRRRIPNAKTLAVSWPDHPNDSSWPGQARRERKRLEEKLQREQVPID